MYKSNKEKLVEYLQVVNHDDRHHIIKVADNLVKVYDADSGDVICTITEDHEFTLIDDSYPFGQKIGIDLIGYLGKTLTYVTNAPDGENIETIVISYTHEGVEEVQEILIDPCDPIDQYSDSAQEQIEYEIDTFLSSQGVEFLEYEYVEAHEA